MSLAKAISKLTESSQKQDTRIYAKYGAASTSTDMLMRVGGKYFTSTATDLELAPPTLEMDVTLPGSSLVVNR